MFFGGGPQKSPPFTNSQKENTFFWECLSVGDSQHGPMNGVPSSFPFKPNGFSFRFRFKMAQFTLVSFGLPLKLQPKPRDLPAPKKPPARAPAAGLDSAFKLAWISGLGSRPVASSAGEVDPSSGAVRRKQTRGEHPIPGLCEGRS